LAIYCEDVTLNRVTAIEILLLVLVANITLFLPQVFNYPYSEIPDFFAHLGRSASILQTGHVSPQYPTSYLTFPSIFILAVQLSLVTGGGLLLPGLLVPAILCSIYAMLVYLIIKSLVGDTKIAFFGGFIAIVTDVAATNIIFFAPGYLNWMLILLAEFIAWKILLSQNKVSPKTFLLLFIVTIAIATGDPIYSVGYILALMFLMIILLIKYRSMSKLVNLYKVLLISVFPSLMYYLFSSKWLIFQLPALFRPFLNNMFDNFLFSAGLPSSSAASSLDAWLRIASLTSRIVYFFIGITGIATIFLLIAKGRIQKNNRFTLPASIALATILSGAIFFGIGEGYSSLAGRFQQFSYLYLSCFSILAIYLCLSKIVRSNYRMKKYLKFFTPVLMFILILAYVPIHLDSSSVGENSFYASKFYVNEGVVVYTPVYNPPIMAVVGFFTGSDLLSGPTPYYNNLPINITENYHIDFNQRVNIVYSNGGEIMEVLP
jgi:hypothetical protein